MVQANVDLSLFGIDAGLALRVSPHLLLGLGVGGLAQMGFPISIVGSWPGAPTFDWFHALLFARIPVHFLELELGLRGAYVHAGQVDLGYGDPEYAVPPVDYGGFQGGPYVQLGIGEGSTKLYARLALGFDTAHESALATQLLLMPFAVRFEF
jgi:hypothetical protein